MTEVTVCIQSKAEKTPAEELKKEMIHALV